MTVPREDALSPDEGAATESREVSLEQQAYERLRNGIIDGTVPPGTKLRERVVAQQLGISRIPLREAFARLESEGLIESIPRRGKVVTQLTPRDAAELFEVRTVLEVLATRLAAAQCAEGASTSALASILGEAEAAITDDDGPRLGEANARFHAEIFTLAQNRLLEDVMATISGRVNRLFYIVPESQQINFHREHTELLRAIASGQSELAAALAYAHVEHSRHETLPRVEALLRHRGAEAPDAQLDGAVRGLL